MRFGARPKPKGVFTGALIDVTDGFIHFSTASQAAETARRHFAGQADLLLVAIDADRLGAALRYEASRGGDLFPHLYAPLELSAVRWVKPLPLGCGWPRLSGPRPRDRPARRAPARHLLFGFDPETAHGLSIKALKCGLLPVSAPRDPAPSA